jgi:hypothetical protein
MRRLPSEESFVAVDVTATDDNATDDSASITVSLPRVSIVRREQACSCETTPPGCCVALVQVVSEKTSAHKTAVLLIKRAV